MEKTLPDRQSVWLDPLRGLRALTAGVDSGFGRRGAVR